MAVFSKYFPMKKIHLINIGLPRCGTSWLWVNLSHHPALNFKNYYIKENTALFDDKNFYKYAETYSPYDISANFNPGLWIIDKDLIKFLGNYSTHVSVILRNPYEYAERYYDFLKDNDSTDEFINWLIDVKILNYSSFVKRWKDNIPPDVKFKIFYFDDLKKDSKLFLSNYFKFIGIDATINDTHKNIINKSKKLQKTKLNFTENQKNIINGYIDDFSNMIEQDLTHWKQ